MVMQSRFVALALALIIPAVGGAQEQPHTVTQMILGAGPAGSRGSGATPVYLLGVDITPASSRITWRVAAEYWSNVYHDQELYPRSETGESNTFGVQALGLRSFGHRRFRPYVFGGVGLYSTRVRATMFAPDGSASNPPMSFGRSGVDASLLWGTGFNVRVGGVDLFSEARLPLYRSTGFNPTPAAPLVLGIRFR